jgi:HAD superfamily hydrolase (TIGR01549 family)
MTEMRHTAWLIDLDGTLYTHHWVRLAMAGELLLGGWPVIGTLRAFRGEHERLRAAQIEHGDPFREQIRRTAERTGLSASVVEQTVTEWMIRRPQRWIRTFRREKLFSEIDEYRRAGGRTALVSDYPAREKLSALGLSGAFDAVIACGEPGGPCRLKPHPDGYLAAARSLEISPELCLVIGDREDADGEAARAAGMSFRLVR